MQKTCECCGTTENLTRDHKIPRSKGGTNSPSNIGTLCKYCNSVKGDQIMNYEQLRNYVELLLRQKSYQPYKPMPQKRVFVRPPMSERDRQQLQEILDDDYIINVHS